MIATCINDYYKFNLCKFKLANIVHMPCTTVNIMTILKKEFLPFLCLIKPTYRKQYGFFEVKKEKKCHYYLITYLTFFQTFYAGVLCKKTSTSFQT